MMVRLEFGDYYIYPDDDPGIALPIILGYGSRSFNTSAKVDTGAEVCLFKHEMGLKLGLPLEDGIPTTLDSLGGPIEAFGHEVSLQTCGISFTSFVYFAKYPGLRRNLTRAARLVAATQDCHR